MNENTIKVGINAFALYPGKIGGAEQYLRNVIDKLSLQKDITTHVFLNETAKNIFDNNPNITVHYLNSTIHLESQLNNHIKYLKLDVWFCPLFHLIPIDCKIPSITTIFDIQQEYFSANFDKIVLKDRRMLTRQTLNATDKILTISEFSKYTLIEKFGIDKDKISVTYLDADQSFEHELNKKIIDQMKNKFGGEYIFYPANMWPHKNHIQLLKGFSIALNKYNLNLKMVFTGAKERETDNIQKIIDSENLREKVEYLGYVDQSEMPYIFKCAKMLAFPSLFEGFGIPLVEAMSVGIPIIASTSSSLPEIAGEAAIYFDPNQPEQIAEAIYKVYTDDALRQKLVSIGYERRKLFSWEKCVEDTVKHIKQLYKPCIELPQRISSNPLVSIITPSYNQGTFIRETIESVLSQTYKNIEYIIMDGGSNDNTVEILKEYDGRVKWISEKDGGQADAVNKGLQIAKGEIIGWLNSDDTYYPDAVENAVRALLEFPDVEMVYGEGMYIDKDSNETEPYLTKPFNYEKLAEECFICQPSAFFTKNIAVKAGLLNADLHLCMDYEFWMRIGKLTEILYIPKFLATSRMYEDNKTLSRRDEVYKECCREIKRHYGYVPYTWISGFAHYLQTLNPNKSFRILFARKYIKYNILNFKYTVLCLKKYLNRRQAHKLVQNTIIVNPETQYADGWISEVYKTVLDYSNSGSLYIKGRHILPMKDVLKLKVIVNDILLDELSIENLGEFEKTITLEGNFNERIDVKLVSNITYNPSKEQKNNTDNRNLSILLDDIYII